MKEIPKDSRLLQHTVSSASRKVATMERFPSAFDIKPTSFEQVKNTTEKMREGLIADSHKLEGSDLALNERKQSMTFDFSESLQNASYFTRQMTQTPSKSTVMAVKSIPPMSDIKNLPGDNSDKHEVLKNHLWLNSIVGTEEKKQGIKSGGEAMLQHAELLAKAKDQKLGLAAFDSKSYWAKQGFKPTGLAQHEEEAPEPFPVMTKTPTPKII